MRPCTQCAWLTKDTQITVVSFALPFLYGSYHPVLCIARDLGVSYLFSSLDFNLRNDGDTSLLISVPLNIVLRQRRLLTNYMLNVTFYNPASTQPLNE